MYYIVYLSGLALSFFNKRPISTFLFLVLAFMAFFRYGIAADYFAYEYLYNRLSNSYILEYQYGLDRQEVGFKFIGIFLKNLGIPYQVYLSIFAAVNLIFLLKFCRKYSNNPTLSLILYFCFYYFTWTYGAIRQGVVMAIGIYFLFDCLEKKKPIKFTIIVLLLSLIHTSAVILLVFYFLATKIKFNKTSLVTLTILSIIVSVIPLGAIIAKMSWLPFYYRIAPYLEIQASFDLFDFKSLGRIAFLVVVFIFYNRYVEQSVNHKNMINIYIVSLIFYFIFQFSELTAARLSIYGKFLDIVILVNILYMYKKAINKLLYVYFIITLSFLYLTKELEALEKNFDPEIETILTPYINVFNKDEFRYNSMYYELTD